MKPFIFIVGKAAPGDAAASAAHSRGYLIGLLRDSRTAAVRSERFDRVIDIDFTQLDKELPRLAHTLPQTAGLLCTYENYVVAKSILADRLNLPASSVKAARTCTDKLLMRRAFAAANPAITPEFREVTQLGDALAFAGQVGYPLFLKPTNLVKSLLVLRCADESELRDNFAYASREIAALYRHYQVDHTPRLIVEQGMQGESFSVAAFVDSHGKPHLCDGIVAICTAAEHGYDDTYLYERLLPAPLTEARAQRILDVARQGIQALDMRSTPAHVELIDDGTRCRLIEIGARIGGYRPRMYAASYGSDLTAQEISLALGETPDVRGRFIAYSAVYELFPEHEGTFVGIEGGDTQLTDQYAYYRVAASAGHTIGPAAHGYKAAAIIIIAHPDKTVFDRLRASVDQLKVQVSRA